MNKNQCFARFFRKWYDLCRDPLTTILWACHKKAFSANEFNLIVSYCSNNSLIACSDKQDAPGGTTTTRRCNTLIPLVCLPVGMRLLV